MSRQPSPLWGAIPLLPGRPHPPIARCRPPADAGDPAPGVPSGTPGADPPPRWRRRLGRGVRWLGLAAAGAAIGVAVDHGISRIIEMGWPL